LEVKSENPEKSRNRVADQFAAANIQFAGANRPRARTKRSAGAAPIREVVWEMHTWIRGRELPVRSRGTRYAQNV